MVSSLKSPNHKDMNVKRVNITCRCVVLALFIFIIYLAESPPLHAANLDPLDNLGPGIGSFGAGN